MRRDGLMAKKKVGPKDTVPQSISFEEPLLKRAQAHADKQGFPSFTAYVIKLVKEDLEAAGQPVSPTVKHAIDATIKAMMSKAKQDDQQSRQE